MSSEGRPNVFRVGSEGNISSTWVNDSGGVQFLELCSNIYDGRGFISNQNNGNNTSYYLCAGIWYRTLSPNSIESDVNAHVIHLGSGGPFSSSRVKYSDSGVLKV